MQLISTVPPEFTLHARNAGTHREAWVAATRFLYQCMAHPFVRDLDGNVRRYGSLQDLNNFHKLALTCCPALHSIILDLL